MLWELAPDKGQGHQMRNGAPVVGVKMEGSSESGAVVRMWEELTKVLSKLLPSSSKRPTEVEKSQVCGVIFLQPCSTT